MPFCYKIVHVPGKYFYTPDVLSRSLIGNDQDRHGQDVLFRKMDAAVLSIKPVKGDFLEEIREAQEEDELARKLKKFVVEGWPRFSKIDPQLKPFSPSIPAAKYTGWTSCEKLYFCEIAEADLGEATSWTPWSAQDQATGGRNCMVAWNQSGNRREIPNV